ncbi:MAG: hypothetical protein KJ601_02610 [Nanoarchaeota archaeon]|nr:hypothetical protein [Nanoarchaeota archaeon]
MRITAYVQGYKGSEPTKVLSLAYVYVRLVIQGHVINIYDTEQLKVLEHSYPQIFKELISHIRKIGIGKSINRIRNGIKIAFPSGALNQFGDYELIVPDGPWDYQVWAIVGKNKDEHLQGQSRHISRNETDPRVEVRIIDTTVPTIPERIGVKHTAEEIRESWE